MGHVTVKGGIVEELFPGSWDLFPLLFSLWAFAIEASCCETFRLYGKVSAQWLLKPAQKQPQELKRVSEHQSPLDLKISFVWKRSHSKHSNAFLSTRRGLSVMSSLTWKLWEASALKYIAEHSTWLPNVSPSWLTERMLKADLHLASPIASTSHPQY